MSISKIKVKSAIIKHNDKTSKETTATKTTTLPLKGTIISTTTTTTSTTTFETSLSSPFNKGSPKTIDQNKAKPWSSSNKQGKALNTASSIATTSSSTTPFLFEIV